MLNSQPLNQLMISHDGIKVVPSALCHRFIRVCQSVLTNPVFPVPEVQAVFAFQIIWSEMTSSCVAIKDKSWFMVRYFYLTTPGSLCQVCCPLCSFTFIFRLADSHFMCPVWQVCGLPDKFFLFFMGIVCVSPHESEVILRCWAKISTPLSFAVGKVPYGFYLEGQLIDRLTAGVVDRCRSYLYLFFSSLSFSLALNKQLHGISGQRTPPHFADICTVKLFSCTIWALACLSLFF